MAVDLQPVSSSLVQAIGYDDAARELVVQWQSGKKSAYKDVPPNIAQDVIHAPSVGKAINSSIKNVYSHRYLGDGE